MGAGQRTQGLRGRSWALIAERAEAERLKKPQVDSIWAKSLAVSAANLAALDGLNPLFEVAAGGTSGGTPTISVVSGDLSVNTGATSGNHSILLPADINANSMFRRAGFLTTRAGVYGAFYWKMPATVTTMTITAGFATRPATSNETEAEVGGQPEDWGLFAGFHWTAGVNDGYLTMVTRSGGANLAENRTFLAPTAGMEILVEVAIDRNGYVSYFLNGVEVGQGGPLASANVVPIIAVETGAASSRAVLNPRINVKLNETLPS